MLEPSETVVAGLRRHASLRPQDLALTFLEDGESLEVNRSYAELHARAVRIAARLLQDVAPGSRAILAFRSGPAFVEAFFGCLYAGVIAVPAYPPRPREGGGRLEGIAQACGAAIVLSTRDLVRLAEGGFDQAPNLTRMPWLAVDDDATFDQMTPARSATCRCQRRTTSRSSNIRRDPPRPPRA
jgi:acyl-CoA synthetase (AMP-forming)/AMP-acid ligase II